MIGLMPLPLIQVLMLTARVPSWAGLSTLHIFSHLIFPPSLALQGETSLGSLPEF